MPKVNKLDNLQKDYTIRKFGHKPGPMEFVEQLSNIDVKIYSAPSIADFRQTLAVFLLNTWNDKPLMYFHEADIDTMVKELFKFELLPTAMETINIVWWVNGLDMIDTTHLIRHRMFSFAAQVHGDRDMRDDRVMVKPGIMANEQFFQRYREINELARSLYIDMLDSGLVHGLDARTIMPRNFEHFYQVRCNIKDLIGYCQMRADEQIQTTADNIVALNLWLEVVKRYPFLRGLVNFNKPDDFYVRQSAKGKRNIFPPNAKNDKFDWCEEQFYHPIGRDEFPGGDVYLELRAKLLAQIAEAEARDDNDPIIK
jgi:Thymidylate synthase complementing protein